MKRAPRLVWMQHRLSLCRLVQDSKVYWVSESSSSVLARDVCSIKTHGIGGRQGRVKTVQKHSS